MASSISSSSRVLQVFTQKTLADSFNSLYDHIKDSSLFLKIFFEHVFQPENSSLIRDINNSLKQVGREIETQFKIQKLFTKLHHLYNHPDAYTSPRLSQRVQISLPDFQRMMRVSLEAMQIAHEERYNIPIPDYVPLEATPPLPQTQPVSLDNLGDLSSKEEARNWVREFLQDPKSRGPIPVKYIWDLVAYARNNANVSMEMACVEFIEKCGVLWSTTLTPPENLFRLWNYATDNGLGWLQFAILNCVCSHNYKLILQGREPEVPYPKSKEVITFLEKLYALRSHYSPTFSSHTLTLKVRICSTLSLETFSKLPEMHIDALEIDTERSHELFPKLTELLSKSHTLKSLRISHTSTVTDAIVSLLADALKGSRSIQEIFIPGYAITTRGIESIANLLQANPTLQRVGLGICKNIPQEKRQELKAKFGDRLHIVIE